MASCTIFNDIVLIASLVYWVADMEDDMLEFRSCASPIRTWLFVSYAFVIGYRLVNILGEKFAAKESGDSFLVNLRHRSILPRVLAKLMWIAVLPCFTAWTMLGSYWILRSKAQSPLCLPAGETLFFVAVWHILCYGCIALHIYAGFVAYVRESKLRQAESALRDIENDDMRSRWGDVSHLPDFAALPSNFGAHMSPVDINKLPVKLIGPADVMKEQECSICLEKFLLADRVRQLKGCGHTFHSSCIDLWLLRCAHCPLCKGDVRTDSEANGRET